MINHFIFKIIPLITVFNLLSQEYCRAEKIKEYFNCMIKKRFTNRLRKASEEMNVDYEVVKYGLRVEGAWLLDCIIAIAVCSLLHLAIEAITFILIFTYLRQYCGGYHCKSYLSCGISYVCAVTGISLLSHANSSIASLIAGVTGWVILFTISPVQNENNILEDSEIPVYRMIARKRLTIIMMISVILLLFGQSQLCTVLLTICYLSILCIIQQRRNNEHI